MPLDSHSYLVSQGWGGKGTGLRPGAISRPLAIPQKKTLAGLGKDRDEAFPFWDHLFSAAAKSIQIKCLSDDDDEEERSTNSSNNNVSIKCTSTGILSNRCPIYGTPITSGTNTPEITTPGSRLGLLATAKRDAAKRGLYSKFFRGPVVGPDTTIEEEKRLLALVSQAFSANDSIAETVSAQETIDIQTAGENVHVDLEVSKSLKKKRKSREMKESATDHEDEEAKRERKRRRKEKREKKAESHASEKRHKRERHRGKAEDTGANSCILVKSSPPPISQKDQKVVNVIEKNRFSGNAADDHASEKKRLKKLEKAQAKDAITHSGHGPESLETKSSGSQTKLEKIWSATISDEPQKRKEKRKHSDAE